MITVSTGSDFCREVVARGWLTEEQTAHAAERYRLGKSRSGKTIFWMIDEHGILRDGRIGNSWVSQMLKAREPKFLQDWYAKPCLFGLHLLSQTEITGNCHKISISIVESERSAVVLSELFPECVWLATVYPMNFNVLSFEPLEGCDITLFPRTDPTGSTYLSWLEIADQARRKYHLDISVIDILETSATDEQKSAKIDLIDYLFDSERN